MFEKFSELSKKVIAQSEEIALKMGTQVDTHHILIALLNTHGSLSYEVLKNYNINQEQIQLLLSLSETKLVTNSTVSDDYKDLLTKAMKIAVEHHHIMVDCEHLLLALLGNKKYSAYRLLLKMGVNPEDLKKNIEKLFEELAYLDEIIMDTSGDVLGVKVEGKNQKTKKVRTPALDYFAKDLIKLAKQNKFDPLIGRTTELNSIMQILLRRNKNNPILVGEPGVGKTAIVEGLTQIIAKGKASSEFEKTKIFILDIALLVAGTTYRGQFEERVKKIIEELENIPDSIVFIDEIHTLVGAGSAEGSLDMANILKPVLTRKTFRLIGATTAEEFRRFIEKDVAFERRFQKIDILEPNKIETKKILVGLKSQYEKFHKIKINDDAIDFIIEATDRYLPQKHFPDKAIDVIDQSLAGYKMKLTKKKPDITLQLNNKLEAKHDLIKKAIEDDQFDLAIKLQEEENKIKQEIKMRENQKNKKVIYDGEITIEDCAEIISRHTFIPVEHILSIKDKKISQIDKNLKTQIIGQEEAIDAIAKAIWRSRTGISNPNRPFGSFLFLGPTGVGKTELAKNLAFELYGSKKSIIKLDMSEFMERHSASSLIGAPPGYIGYQDAGRLTESVKRNPYSIVLFDEIEKAHPDIFNILLQILEDGYLTDSTGTQVNFRNTLIILTSNIGMKELTQEAEIGFKQFDSANDFVVDKQYQKIQSGVEKKVKEQFAPEFLNRLDQMIIFKPLGKNEIVKIVNLQLEELKKRISLQGIKLEIYPPAIDFLAQKGFDPEMGARPVRRAISEHLETAIAVALMHSKNQKNNFRVLVKGDKLVLSH